VADIDWPRWLRAGDHVVCSHLSAEPVALLDSLTRCPQLPEPLHLMLGTPFSLAAAELPAGVELTTYGGMGSAGALAQRRPVHLSPLPYSRSELVYRQGHWKCDVALVALGRGADGRLHLAPSHGPVLAAAHHARHVIAQVSPQVPCMSGAQWPDDLPIAQLLETSGPPLLLLHSEPSAAEQAIAAHLVPLVPDGACLQVGIGTLPSAVVAGLAGHRHLGIHSGIVTPALWRLVECGAADHSRKPLDAGVAVTGAVYGDAALYAAVDRRPDVALRPPGYTHDARVIAALPGMFCLNSVLEVDLLGNANAETVLQPDGRWRWVGGVGGLPDFVRAAVQAPGGQSMLALPARTPRGKPRIVARLSGPCTVAACDADLVATEHGVARLRDASVGARVRRMLAIAHPEDRDALAAEARGVGLI
jgi:acyl-CoA hydrolase